MEGAFMNDSTAPLKTIRRTAWALTLAILGCPICTEAGEPESPVKPYYNFLYYTSVGDVGRALAEFSDDAIVVVRPWCPPEKPCQGRKSIKERYVSAIVRDRK